MLRYASALVLGVSFSFAAPDATITSCWVGTSDMGCQQENVTAVACYSCTYGVPGDTYGAFWGFCARGTDCTAQNSNCKKEPFPHKFTECTSNDCNPCEKEIR